MFEPVYIKRLMKAIEVRLREHLLNFSLFSLAVEGRTRRKVHVKPQNNVPLCRAAKYWNKLLR